MNETRGEPALQLRSDELEGVSYLLTEARPSLLGA